MAKRKFNSFVRELINNRDVCRNTLALYDRNTMDFLIRYIRRFVDRFDLIAYLNNDTLLRIYVYLLPDIRNFHANLAQQFAIFQVNGYPPAIPNTLENMQHIDTQVTNILRLIYHINLGFDNMIIVNTLLEGDEPNTREIDIGQLFIMYNYRTGQALILFHIATDGEIYPNLTIPNNIPLQNRLRAAVGTEPFTMNNIHGGWGAGGYTGQALGFCASVFRRS